MKGTVTTGSPEEQESGKLDGLKKYLEDQFG